ncbi:MAG TPA: glycosyltransferase [Candidatus Saccharibacteria bacterium]|jgi:dolichyl-phosphate beta-glucosyltransferase|nr:glycosyltransferase [Candidatus Saccharibacteria bacterium]
MKLSIIMPAYNEAIFIGDSIKATASYLSKELKAESVEVLVIVNSPASDGTFSAAQEALSELKLSKNHNFIIHDALKRLGKGGAVKLGMKIATGDYKLFMDTDLSTPLHHIKDALSLIEKSGADIIIGARNIKKAHSTLIRRLSSKASNFAVRALILPGFSDTQCGFKMFTKDASKLVFSRLTSTGWSFDMEALLIARNHKMKVAKMPIKDWHDPKQDGLGGDNTSIAMLKELKELLRFWFNNIRGKYKK